MRRLSLKSRLALASALLGAGTLATAAILWLSMDAVGARLERAIAAEARIATYAALSSQAATFLVVATEAVQSNLAPETRRDRLQPVADQLTRTFADLQRNVETAVADAAALGLEEQARYGTQSLGLARMKALLDNAVHALARADTDPSALRTSIDIFSAGFDPLLSQAVNAELVFRNAILSGIARLRANLRLTAFVIVALTALAVGAFYLVLIRPQFFRLDRLRDAARRIGAEDFSVALPTGETDEIGRLFGETNRMAAALARRQDEIQAEWARLNQTIEDRTRDLRAANATLSEIDTARRRFFADISHELRTPLTVILMEAQLGARCEGSARAAFATIESRAARLTRRIDDLLRVARSDTGQLQLDRQAVDLPGLIAEIAREVGAEIDNAGMTLAVGETPAITILADRNWLRQVFAGLIRNAIRHARDGGTVALDAIATPDTVQIAVTDNGPGIAAADQARVFERFAQGGTGNAQGFGIGLALARWVVQEHGGDIALTSPVARNRAQGSAPGTKIAVRLPRPSQ